MCLAHLNIAPEILPGKRCRRRFYVLMCDDECADCREKLDHSYSCKLWIPLSSTKPCAHGLVGAQWTPFWIGTGKVGKSNLAERAPFSLGKKTSNPKIVNHDKINFHSWSTYVTVEKLSHFNKNTKNSSRSTHLNRGKMTQNYIHPKKSKLTEHAVVNF